MPLAQRWMFGSFAALCAATSVSAAHGSDHAIVIGVGQYAELPQDRWLHGPKNDAAMMVGLLTGSLGYAPDQVTLLQDSAATKQAIESAFKDLATATGAGDRVFIYFSGHGVQVPDLNGDEDDGLDEALATYDIKVGSNSFENVIIDDQVDELVKGLPGRFVTLVFDACHSGTANRSIGGQQVEPENARFLSFAGLKSRASRSLKIEPVGVDTTGGVVAWSAATASQLAWDDDRKPVDQRNGVFTEAYVSGIQNGTADTNHNGTVSYSELLNYVQASSLDYCAQNTTCTDHGLNPQLDAPPDVLGYGVVPLEVQKTGAAAPANTYQPPANGYVAPANTYIAPANTSVPPANTYTPPANTYAQSNVYTPPTNPGQQVAYQYAAPQTAPAGTADQYAGKPDEAVMTYVSTHVAAPEPGYGGVQDIMGKPSDGVVTVHILPSADMKVGDTFKIEISSDRAGYLVLYDIGEKGDATQLFPNSKSRKSAQLRANSKFTIPDEDYGFDLTASSPGKGSILAVVMSDKATFDKIAPPSHGFTTVENAKVAENLVTDLKQPHYEAGKEAPTVYQQQWSYALLPYVMK